MYVSLITDFISLGKIRNKNTAKLDPSLGTGSALALF